MDEKEKCCICGKEIEGMGNNPYPERIRLSKQDRYEQGKTDD